MTLKDRLFEDMKKAMKEKESFRKSVITMARAAILQVEKDTLSQLDDEGVIDILAKEVKKRRDAIIEFEKANRQDLADQYQREVDILVEYLPQQLTEEEISQIVSQSAFEVGANTMKDMGKLMAAIMPKLKGRADGKIVNEIVKRHLQ